MSLLVQCNQLPHAGLTGILTRKFSLPEKKFVFSALIVFLLPSLLSLPRTCSPIPEACVTKLFLGKAFRLYVNWKGNYMCVVEAFRMGRGKERSSDSTVSGLGCHPQSLLVGGMSRSCNFKMEH